MADILLSLRPNLLNNIKNNTRHREVFTSIKPSYVLDVILDIKRKDNIFIIIRTNNFVFNDYTETNNVYSYILYNHNDNYTEYKLYTGINDPSESMNYILKNLFPLKHTIIKQICASRFNKISYNNNDLFIQKQPSYINVCT